MDISGHPPFHWLKIIISDWHFLAVFRVLNFWGRFEALNDIFLALFEQAIAFLFRHCTPWRDLSNGLLSEPNRDRMQKLCPREVGLPIYHFEVNKIVGVSSFRVELGFSYFHSLC